jgi:trehalose 6-phosphate phosphatase
LAAAADGAAETLEALADHYAEVAVISGRPADQLRSLLPIEGVRFVGLYGLTSSDLAGELLERVEAAASLVEGAWSEPKGASVAVHFRASPDPDAARTSLAIALGHLAEETGGLEVIEGKMTLELVPEGAARKGGAAISAIEEGGLDAVLYAGDDVADLEAFDELAHAGLGTLVRVAVQGDETPQALLDAADLIAPGPDGLVVLLRQLLPD